MNDDTRKEAEENILEQARLVFEHFSPKEGDIITVTVPEDMPEVQAMQLSEIISEAVPVAVQVMILMRGVTIDVISEEEMNNMGWQRMPRH